MDQRDQQTPAPSRRDFIKTSAAVVGGTMASSLVIPGAYAAGSDEIKVGLIGCGGRGTGAVDNVLSAAQGVRLVAVGDMFKDRLQDSLQNLTEVRREVGRARRPPVRRLGRLQEGPRQRHRTT